MKPRLCIDFDGVITADGKTVITGCVEVLAKLRRQYSVAIFSARATDAERADMRRLLNANDVPYDEILPPKPEAVAFIDDKGIRFQGWDKIEL